MLDPKSRAIKKLGPKNLKFLIRKSFEIRKTFEFLLGYISGLETTKQIFGTFKVHFVA
jgi:hypothetical protein